MLRGVGCDRPPRPPLLGRPAQPIHSLPLPTQDGHSLLDLYTSSQSDIPQPEILVSLVPFLLVWLSGLPSPLCPTAPFPHPVSPHPWLTACHPFSCAPPSYVGPLTDGARPSDSRRHVVPRPRPPSALPGLPFLPVRFLPSPPTSSSTINSSSTSSILLVAVLESSVPTQEHGLGRHPVGHNESGRHQAAQEAVKTLPGLVCAQAPKVDRSKLGGAGRSSGRRRKG